jgi:hypothetical protein
VCFLDSDTNKRLFFDGNAWMQLSARLQPHKSSQELEILEFDIKTEHDDGLIWWQSQASGAEDDYQGVFLKNGRLVFT